MKFQVKVGTEFELSESRGSAKSNPVTVHVTVANGDTPEKKSPKWKWISVAVGTAIVAVSLPALAYGLATGDYSLLKALAGHLNDFLAQAIKLAGTALNTK
jgi:hypothetical protein